MAFRVNEGLRVVVVPVNNGDGFVEHFKRDFNTADFPADQYRLVLVNDGSTDQTLVSINRWAAEDLRVSVVSHSACLGAGKALSTGFHDAVQLGADCIVTMEIWQPVGLIPVLIEAVHEGADIASVSRFVSGGGQIGVPWMRRTAGHAARMLLRLVFPLKGITDYTLGFRAYDASLIRRLMARSDTFLGSYSFAASAEVLLKAAPLSDRMTEVPMVLNRDAVMFRIRSRRGSKLAEYIKLFFMPKERCFLGRGLRTRERSDLF